MNIDYLLILFYCLCCGVPIILILFFDFDSSDFIAPAIILFLIVISLTSIFDSKLKSELIIEEYLRSSYTSKINSKDISNILKSYDKNAELLNIKTYEIPNSKSLYVELDIKKGKFIYDKLEYKYTIGMNNDKVFIKKGD